MAGERTLPGLGLTGFWDLGDNTWKAGMDGNLRLLSVVAPGLVDSREGSAPGSPADGDIVIAASDWGATVTAQSIQVRDSGSWVEIIPAEGWKFYDQETNELLIYSGSVWDVFSGGEGGGSATMVQNDGLGAGDPVGGHTGWRIRSISTPSTDYTGIHEVEFNEVVGEKTTGTAVASSEYSTSGTYSAQAAFDGLSGINDYWVTELDEHVGAWVGYIEPSAYAVTSVALTAPDAAFVDYMPTEFAVDYSDDGTTWTEVATYTTTWSADQRRVFSVSTTVPSTSYDVSSVDLDGRTVWLPENTSAIDVGVPSGLVADGPLTVIRKGTGAISFVAGAGVTILSADDKLSIRAQNGSATLIPDLGETDTYYLIGDLDT